MLDPRAVAKDDADTRPSKKTSKSSSGGPDLVKLYVVMRGVALVFGLIFATLGWMAVFSLVFDAPVIAFALGLLLALGSAVLAADRAVRMLKTPDRAAFGVDVAALALSVSSLVFVLGQPLFSKAFVREGDNLARVGAPTIARVAYLLGGVRPEFPAPTEKK